MTENLGPEKFHTYPKPVRFFLAFAIAARNLSRRLVDVRRPERESFLCLSLLLLSENPPVQCTNLATQSHAFDPLLGTHDYCAPWHDLQDVRHLSLQMYLNP